MYALGRPPNLIDFQDITNNSSKFKLSGTSEMKLFKLAEFLFPIVFLCCLFLVFSHK
jgi:hypothetical protein